MKSRHGKQFGAVLGLCGVVVGCDGPTRPSAQPTGASLALAGAYQLTIRISDHCTEVPETERQRTYRATLTDSHRRYFGVEVTGGGYATPTVTGDVWPETNTRARIDWNNFDIFGCDGYVERLPSGTGMMVCGSGAAEISSSGLFAELSGDVVLEDQFGRQRRACPGVHQFRFTRVTAQTMTP